MPDGRIELWRAFVPRWSHLPLSGEGAAQFGGRWNPVGTPAIYAARELSTAWTEYNQGFVQHPALIVRLELFDADLVDLTDDAVLDELGLDSSIHSCEWRQILEAGEEPPTHRVQKQLARMGHHGVIYPSFMSRGGTCVALWTWNGRDGPRLKAVDPEGRLPKSPASWL